MKTSTIILALLLEVISITHAQVVNIPDANFKALLVANPAINTNSDSEIQVSEAITYTDGIDCSSMNIQDLTGIEAFTNLTYLSCIDNQLISLDVTSNTALTHLICSDNLITSLDLSNNIALTHLTCRNMLLTTLDLSNNTSLTNLACDGNTLLSLDLSNNTALISLNCKNNAILSSLNVKNGNNTNFIYFNATQNPQLTCIEVDDTAYSNANWVNIDTTAFFSENCTNVGVENILEDKYSVIAYPSPTRGLISLAGTFNVILSDLTGKTIVQQYNTKLIDISNQPTGMYFIFITDNYGHFLMKEKILKE